MAFPSPSTRRPFQRRRRAAGHRAMRWRSCSASGGGARGARGARAQGWRRGALVAAARHALMPQLRAAACARVKMRAWAALQTARQALSVEADVDAAAASWRARTASRRRRRCVCGRCVAYARAHQSLDAAAALRVGRVCHIVSALRADDARRRFAEVARRRFVTREDAGLLTDNAARRGAEMATEVRSDSSNASPSRRSPSRT